VAYQVLPALLLNELQREHALNQTHTAGLALQQERIATQASELNELKQQLAELRELVVTLKPQATASRVAMR